MKLALALALFPLLSTSAFAQRPWQQITVPSVGEAAANFKAPPHEYGAIQPFQSWNGAPSGYDAQEVRARIVRDLDRLSANGIFIINLSPGRRAPGEGKYLSPEHMDQVKFTVAELAKRNMRAWIQDESDYPSGFAGGYISERYPQLGMQDIVADITVHVAPGQTVTMPVPANTLDIMAVESDLTVISFTSAPWMKTSPCQTWILRVPGLEGSENAIWLDDSSARAVPVAEKARASARIRGEQAVMVFINGIGVRGF